MKLLAIIAIVAISLTGCERINRSIDAVEKDAELRKTYDGYRYVFDGKTTISVGDNICSVGEYDLCLRIASVESEKITLIWLSPGHSPARNYVQQHLYMGECRIGVPVVVKPPPNSQHIGDEFGKVKITYLRHVSDGEVEIECSLLK